MVDIIKITSPVSIKNKVQDLPSKLPTDAVFDIKNPHLNQVIKEYPNTKGADSESGKQSLLKNINKEIFEPLLHSTRAQADGVRKLVLMAKLFETSDGILSESFLEKIFVKPRDMLAELLTWEKGAVIFKGEFFDSLRMLAKLEGQPKLREAVVNILKYFDCYVHQENSLKSVIVQGNNLALKLTKAEASELRQQIETLDAMVKLSSRTRQNLIAGQTFAANPDKLAVQDLKDIINQDKTSQTEIKLYLKNEIIPKLGIISKRHQGSDRIYNQVMNIVHNIVRYDKADPALLEDAVFQLGDNLKQMTNLTDEDIIEMKKLVFESAIEEQKLGEKQNTNNKLAERYGAEPENNDIASLLSKAMDKSGPVKIHSLAQNLLMNLVQSESPLIPVMHFTIPFRFMDENTYGEFFVDKDSRERKGGAKDAKNIFFTIQSDKYGNFEVDILVRDKSIDLDIRCPNALTETIKEAKSKWRGIIEEQGYRLAACRIDVYQESKTILQRFPELASRKVGIDVKV
ncbi:MAG: hypothetical protein PHV71_02030 [Eubacteriales bacterium]|nr:hypothetical protein [Eubacteriales bacterium]MDD3199234.1 hypothetical protein [Eubacteriales bacterium]MDD4122545.1 hypothetical protein [Eubacteriales bacterium]MDD4629365.1 hypothetical protein [Eubacteriales bacterium]